MTVLSTDGTSVPFPHLDLPHLDHRSIAILVEDLSLPSALAYLAVFDEMLDARVARIDRSLNGADQTELETALLSLQASAGMAGAKHLCRTATTALRSMSSGPTVLGSSTPSSSTPGAATPGAASRDSVTAVALVRQLRRDVTLFRSAYHHFLIDTCPAAA